MSLPKPTPTDNGASYHDWLKVRNANAELEQEIYDELLDMVGRLSVAEGGSPLTSLRCRQALRALRA